MTSIIGAVVTYNPSAKLATNIASYIQSVDAILVVDNSDKSHNQTEILKKFPSLYYIKNKENAGIAKALNQAASFAIDRGYEWLLTMDQDSWFSGESARLLVDQVIHPSRSVGLFTPVHINKDTILRSQVQEQQVVKKTMTSGNLLNLSVYKKCGPFDEKLFIDYVDHEYNFRLRKNGYKIVRINTSYLLHNQGNIRSYKFLVFSMKTTNHDALRRYYITRNRLFVIFKYFRFAPKFFFKELYQYWVDCLRILLLERDKKKKFLAVLKGTCDWLTSSYGKYTL